MGSIEVSVVVPTYNRLSILKRTIQCLIGQSYGQERYEIIVVDDCSTDGTNDYLKALRSPVSLKIIRNRANLGRAKARNVGIRAARGTYILMVDDDIWATETLIERHYAIHANAGRDMAVVGAIVPSPEVPSTAVNRFCSAHHQWCYDEMSSHQNGLPYGFCKTANLSIPRHLINDIGLFDERFSGYGGEDTELGMRISARGIPLIFAEHAVGYHYHDESVDSQIEKIQDMGMKLASPTYCSGQEPFPDKSIFFVPCYAEGMTAKAILYNAVKRVLFHPFSFRMNVLLIRCLDRMPAFSPLLVRCNLPILRMQCLRTGLRKATS